MKASIPAMCGPPYTIERHGRLISLNRKIGIHNNRVLFSHADVIRVCNALVDAVEAGK
ncbi:hypothetical protein [Mycobacterium intracellulare]|uniref:hypothetical protein n=1 Tax=Mycobacterium intracellulare TaxID=1767 RepID=UPI0012FE4A70|nr:hypothetical protein [Mycobacterium intracellulare]MCA2231118.1 hypothetical protein [Mycobacterium intracellulare]